MKIIFKYVTLLTSPSNTFPDHIMDVMLTVMYMTGRHLIAVLRAEGIFVSCKYPFAQIHYNKISFHGSATTGFHLAHVNSPIIIWKKNRQ